MNSQWLFPHTNNHSFFDCCNSNSSTQVSWEWCRYVNIWKFHILSIDHDAMRFVCIQKWWDFSSQLTIATHLFFFAGKFFFSFPYGILFSTLSLTLSHLILDALEISEQEISWEKRVATFVRYSSFPLSIENDILYACVWNRKN